MERCSHCHHTRLHRGCRQQCLRQPLKAVTARNALVCLNDGIALAVAEHIAATLVRTPRATHDQVTGHVGPVPKPLVWMVGVPPVEWFLRKIIDDPDI
jgi:hypothetical protein